MVYDLDMVSFWDLSLDTFGLWLPWEIETGRVKPQQRGVHGIRAKEERAVGTTEGQSP